MGNAPLAAFLKNSLRDWSSSFSFFPFIRIRIDTYRPPSFGVNKRFIDETIQKSVEIRACCPSHTLRLLALPILVERATRNPRRWVYIIILTLQTSSSLLYGYNKGMTYEYTDAYKNIPWASTVAMFRLRLKFCENFRVSRTKRLANAFYI